MSARFVAGPRLLRQDPILRSVPANEARQPDPQTDLLEIEPRLACGPPDEVGDRDLHIAQATDHLDGPPEPSQRPRRRVLGEDPAPGNQPVIPLAGDLQFKA